VSFYTDIIQKDKRFTSKLCCKDVNLLEPGFRAAMAQVMLDAHNLGIDLRLMETFRSSARQQELFAKHLTKLQKVGCHGFGLACDVGVFVGGKYAESGNAYAFLKDVARKRGLIWGGSWGWDFGHLQRIPIWRQNQVFDGEWYPPADYDPYKDRPLSGGAKR
jgi:hypothetical protein